MNLIKTISYFNDSAKVHLQKDELTHDSLCGLSLGFSYTIIEEQTQNIDVENSDAICKRCKSIFLKKHYHKEKRKNIIDIIEN